MYQPFLDEGPAAPAASFKTAPVKGSGAISFIAFGDSGTGSPEQRQLADVMARDTFDFAMHVGDIAYGSGDGEGDATFTTYQSYLFDIYSWLPSRAFVPVEGNHDSRPSNGNGTAYVSLFELPRNGATAAFPDHAERYYSFDYGPVHFIALDTEFAFLDPARQAEQLRWAAADLAATSQPWTIAFFHRAPYSAGGEHGSSPDVRQAFGPLFERYGVDLVLAGHEHDYERTIPIRESATTTDQFVPYVVTGGGGAPLYPAGTSSWTAFSASRHEYVKVTVDACALTLNAIGLDGAVFDTTTVTHCGPGNASPTVALTSPASRQQLHRAGDRHADRQRERQRRDDRQGGLLCGRDAARHGQTAPYTVTWTTVPAGSYTLTAVATDNGAATASASPITITVSPTAPPPTTLPAGWSHADVGSTGAAGSASAASGTFTIAGAGADVWGTADAVHYAYQTLDGDGDHRRPRRVDSERERLDQGRRDDPQLARAVRGAGLHAGRLVPGQGRSLPAAAGERRRQREYFRQPVDRTALGQAGTRRHSPHGLRVSRRRDLDGRRQRHLHAGGDGAGGPGRVEPRHRRHRDRDVRPRDRDPGWAAAAQHGTGRHADESVERCDRNRAGDHHADRQRERQRRDDREGRLLRGHDAAGYGDDAPPSPHWSSVPEGSYTLTAVATDDDAAATTSNAAPSR